MELRLQIPDHVVTSLQEKLAQGVKGTDIAREAITLFNWAVEERAKGRVILSANEDGKDLAKLAMTILNNVRRDEAAREPRVPVASGITG